MARSHFSHEKRRKELDKKKQKDAKREAKAERKAAEEAGEEIPEPVIIIDEFGNAVEVVPEVVPDADSAPNSVESNDTSEVPDPA